METLIRDSGLVMMVMWISGLGCPAKKAEDCVCCCLCRTFSAVFSALSVKWSVLSGLRDRYSKTTVDHCHLQ